MTAKISTTHLTTILQDTRSRTLELIAGLNEEQLMGPQIATVNPMRWEIGHVAYFYEYFILRRMYGHESLLGSEADKLYDSINITLGLPFIRISPDHGPNERMLGKNKSNPLSLIKALTFLDFRQ